MQDLTKKINHGGHGDTEDTERNARTRLPGDLNVISLCTSVLFCFSLAAMPAGTLEKPLLSIDQECTAFSMAADGRVVYAVRHTFTKNKIQMERDDIWMADAGGKRRRIVEGEKLIRGTGPFSYQVHA